MQTSIVRRGQIWFSTNKFKWQSVHSATGCCFAFHFFVRPIFLWILSTLSKLDCSYWHSLSFLQRNHSAPSCLDFIYFLLGNLSWKKMLHLVQKGSHKSQQIVIMVLRRYLGLTGFVRVISFSLQMSRNTLCISNNRDIIWWLLDTNQARMHHRPRTMTRHHTCIETGDCMIQSRSRDSSDQFHTWIA